MPGTFVFRPIEANLTHDTDWLGNMDPYCAYMINNKRIKGQICKEGGVHPVWNEAVTVPIEADQPACVVELLDKDKILPDDSIGTFVIDLNEVKNRGSVNRWYPIYHKNKPAGEILFETVYQPAQTYMPATEIKPVLVSTPIITETKPVIQETVTIEKTVVTEPIIEKVVTREPTILTSNVQTSHFTGGMSLPETSYQNYHSTIHSHELPHTSSIEDPLYGKIVGVKGIEHVGGVLYSSTHHSHLGNQPLITGSQSSFGGQNISQPLSGTQFNQPLSGNQFNQQLDPNLRSGQFDQSNLQNQNLFNQGTQPGAI